MQNNFLNFIKEMGIFLICAESILHFIPGKSYQKYVKLLIGVMLLAQFLIPVRAVLTGQEKESIKQEITEFQKILESKTEQLEVRDSENAVYNSIQNEIKSRLNKIAFQHEYQITNIDWKQEALSGKEAADKEINGIIVSVSKTGGQEKSDSTETINVPKVELSSQATKKTTAQSPDSELEKLKTLFCAEIGTRETYMEVIRSE